MNPNLIQLGILPGNLDYFLYGAVLLVVIIIGILVLNFGMIYVRALTSGAKVKIL